MVEARVLLAHQPTDQVASAGLACDQAYDDGHSLFVRYGNEKCRCRRGTGQARQATLYVHHLVHLLCSLGEQRRARM
jgi:hypothetical protein